MTLNAYGQQNVHVAIDSMLLVVKTQKSDTIKVKTLNQLAKFYRTSDPSKELFYANEALKLSSILKWEEGLSRASDEIGIYYFYRAKYTEALDYFFKALALAEKVNNKLLIASISGDIGQVYNKQLNLVKAREYIGKMLKMGERLKNNRLIQRSYSNIADTYNAERNYITALDYDFKALSISEANNFKIETCVNYSTIGATYANMKDYEEALFYQFKCIKLAKELGMKDLLAVTFLNIGASYNELAENEVSTNNTIIPPSKQERIKLSLEYIQKAENQLLAIGFRQPLLKIYTNKVFLNAMLNNPKGVKQAFGDFEDLKDSIYKATNKETIKNLEDKRTIDVKTKENEINDLRLRASENVINQQSLIAELNKSKLDESIKEGDLGKIKLSRSQALLKNEQLEKIAKDKQLIISGKETQLDKLMLASAEKQKWYYILGLASLLIIGGLLFWQSRTRKRLNTQLLIFNDELDQSNKVKTRFFSILNHDLRSPVTNLVHFLHLQKESPELINAENKIRLENKTTSAIENLLQSMEDLLLWSKSQMENFKPQFKNVRVEELFDELQKQFGGLDHISLNFKNSENITINTDQDCLKTVLRNLTSNAVKALQNTSNAKVEWRAYSKNNINYLSITDNGPGATETEFKALYDENEVVGIKTGLGLHLIRDFAKAINCQISVQTKPGNTTFLLMVS